MATKEKTWAQIKKEARVRSWLASMEAGFIRENMYERKAADYFAINDFVTYCEKNISKF